MAELKTGDPVSVPDGCTSVMTPPTDVNAIQPGSSGQGPECALACCASEGAAAPSRSPLLGLGLELGLELGLGLGLLPGLKPPTSALAISPQPSLL